MKRIKMADALDWLLCGRSPNLNVTLKEQMKYGVVVEAGEFTILPVIYGVKIYSPNLDATIDFTGGYARVLHNTRAVKHMLKIIEEYREYWYQRLKVDNSPNQKNWEKLKLMQ